jgi:hypothetical protein
MTSSPRRQQSLGQMAADKAGRAGDKNGHTSNALFLGRANIFDDELEIGRCLASG